MAFWAYILRCADGSFYTGHTDNLDARIGQHQTGGFCDYTSRRLPVELAWCQDFSSRIEALEAEFRVKRWSRAKKEGLIAGDWGVVSYFARPPRERVSTSLDPNGGGDPINFRDSDDPAISQPPFASSEVEKHSTTL
jgi:predicted GIY-YIG superfamily endonuclease